MCSHRGEVIIAPNCQTACSGCTWTANVTSVKEGTNCVFTWTVNRDNCNFSRPAVFTGTTTVPCDENSELIFYCDAAGACPGYKLTLTGDPCPAPPD